MNGRTVLKFLERNASTILTYVGIVGFGGTVYLAVKETPKAIELIKQAEREKGEKLTVTETIVTAAPAYGPAIGTGLATVSCFVGANLMDRKQQASMIGAYAMLDRMYKDNKSKIHQFVDPDVRKKMAHEIAKDDFKEDMIPVSEEKQLFYAHYLGDYFESSMADVLKAEYKLNGMILNRGSVTLNEFLGYLGVEPIMGGDEVGWVRREPNDESDYALVDFTHELFRMDDGLEYVIIDILKAPSTIY